MTKIAFLGLGNMGVGMASRLLAAGHDVAVYNRTRSKAESLVAHGARVAASPRDAAEGAEAVFSMVSDDEASRASWFGEAGALAGNVRPGAYAIECSTLSHDWVLELAAAAAAKGLRYIDCPVTGLPDVAAAGTLTLFVGADTADLAGVRPLLQPLCAEIVHFGAVGAGKAYKLMINLMGGVQIAAAAEGMAIAEKAGLDLNLVAATIAKGQAASPQVVRTARRIAENAHDRDIVFAGRLRLKDVEYAMRLVEKLAIDAAFGEAARQAYRTLVARGLGDLNESKVIAVARSSGPGRG